MILALETSCDDTCAALLGDDGAVLSSVISSQGVHDRYGGVVPEIASRHHLELVNAVVEDALARAGASLEEVRLVAVTETLGRSRGEDSLRLAVRAGNQCVSDPGLVCEERGDRTTCD